MITYQNDGALLVASNYWESPQCRAGKLAVSINARTFRLLIPPPLEASVADMRAARECLVSRGPWPAEGLADGFEILFDDETPSPFALHLAVDAFGGMVPSDEWIGPDLRLTVWKRERDRPRLVLDRACWYRRAPKIPYLMPRE